MMNFLESVFLDLGFSYTLAKLCPYLFMLLLGIVLSYTIQPKFSNKLFKWLVRLITSAIPFSIYFIFFPIYQGDFSRSYLKTEQLSKFPKEVTLSIVVLPGCPYCHESIPFMNELIKREPKLLLRYVVVAETDFSLEAFRKKLNKSIKVERTESPKKWIRMVHGGFPCMILSKNGKIIHAWDNDHFGVRAIDEVIQTMN